MTIHTFTEQRKHPAVSAPARCCNTQPNDSPIFTLISHPACRCCQADATHPKATQCGCCSLVRTVHSILLTHFGKPGQ